MENTKDKKKEKIKVGDYVKVVKNVYAINNKSRKVNIFATIAEVTNIVSYPGLAPNSYLIRFGISKDNPKGCECLVAKDKIEKADLDDETRKLMFGGDVVDENACKKMRDFCYGKEALKDVETAIEVQDFEQVTSEMRELYKQKNHDYGNSFGRSFQKYGLISAITRMSDKWERIDSLCQKQAEVKDESIRDTLIDLANYCVMTIMELDKKKAESEQKES